MITRAVLIIVALAACGDNLVPAVPADATPTSDANACDPGFHPCDRVCVNDRAVGTCGTSCTACPSPPTGAVATCDGLACGFACDVGLTWSQGACTPAAPRLIAPLSTATVTSRQPTLRWQLASGTDGARVDLCADRSCANVLATVDVAGSSISPTSELPSGVVFWRVRGMVGAAVGTDSSATWQFTVGTRSATIDTSWGTVLDVNGDGYPDIAVGDPCGSDQAGVADVYAGGANGLATNPTPSLAAPGTGTQLFGSVVASAGDLNGDGFADLVVGAPETSANTGAVYVYFGGSNGIDATPSVTLIGPAGPNGGFGDSLASAGDVNGDGYADVAVGATDTDNYTGRVYIYFGGPNGIDTTPSITLTGSDGENGHFGGVASAGDLDGDGHEDLVVWAEWSQHVFVYFGDGDGLVTPPLMLAAPAGELDGFGISAFGADFNADGYADLVVGGSWATYVYTGGTSGLAALPMEIPSQGQLDYGRALGAGDLDGDGYLDLITGAPVTTDEFVFSYADGSIDVVSGSASGLDVATRDVLFAPGFPYFSFGQSLVAPDIDGDGFADVVVGAPGCGVGCLFVYDGSGSGIPYNPTSAIPSPNTTSCFGMSVD